MYKFEKKICIFIRYSKSMYLKYFKVKCEIIKRY